MARGLEVKNFSCITSAKIDFSRLTLIIGPQASGKSVLCKLAYFFNSLLTEQFPQVEDNADLDGFRSYVAAKFVQLFPVSAWGQKKFDISYAAGQYGIRVQRTSAKSEKIKVHFSDFFEKQYEEVRSAYERLRKKSKPSEVGARIEVEWSVRQKLLAELRKKLNRDFAQYQLFIPAGRSFFTNAGKAIMLLDQGNLVDPIVGRFGRIFANYREHFQFGFVERRGADSLLRWRDILGGDLKIERDREFVETPDGRKVPFVALSSGQQELLPLFIVLGAWGLPSKEEGAQHLYIEEPEAHLFPSAQSNLVEIFAEMLNGSGGLFDLVLTTHSPYVLSKVNNLVKAAIVGRNDGASKAVSKVLRKSSWVDAKQLAAYAIVGGKAISIVDEDGLIDGAYLDSISEEISREFGRLLAIELSSEVGNG